MSPFVSAIDGFNRSYIPEPNSGCWLWEKAVNNKGYGLLQCGGFKGYAHRFSYSYFIGPIPVGHAVCHQCDVPCCVNPDHLWTGTGTDNMQDCLAKGRHASSNPKTNYANGERQGLAKLTWEIVAAIRSSPLSQRRLAAMFGVSKNAIKLVIQQKTWKPSEALLTPAGQKEPANG